MTTYKANFAKVLILWIELFQYIPVIQPFIDNIVKIILENVNFINYLQNIYYTSNEKLIFILDIFKTYDYSNKKVNTSFINIILDYVR